MSKVASGSSPRPSIADGSGKLLPARLELSESSGPVSPRFQYTTHVVIAVASPAAEPTVAVDHAAAGGDPAPATKPLARDLYERLWSELFAHDVFALGGDLTADKKDRVGVSFNHVEVVLGDPGHAVAQVRFDYLLPQLELPENQQRHAVVELLKSFVPQAPAGPTN